MKAAGRKPTGSPAPETGAAGNDDPLNERIRQVATYLFMREGYNGTSFLAIARELGITHSNIHYYFKTKSALAEAVVSRYAAEMLAAYQAVWDSPETDLSTKFVQTRDWAWTRYLRYNPTGSGAAHWGLLDRFTHDSDALSPELKGILRDSTRRLETFIDRGIAAAIASGELAPAAPRTDLALQVATLLYSSRQATRTQGSFERLDRLLRATSELIHRAYGTRPTIAAWPPLAKPITPATEDGSRREPGNPAARSAVRGTRVAARGV